MFKVLAHQEFHLAHLTSQKLEPDLTVQ